MPDNTSRDLVLAPGEFANVLDSTKGLVNVLVGSNKTSMSATDFPVKYDPKIRRFVRCDMDQAIQPFPNAPEGHYMVLTNPALAKDEAHPRESASNIALKLDIGRKINIPGPANFPLWPGQVAEVIEGHRLRSNQYLIVRVYNEKEARENWESAVMTEQTQPPPVDADPKVEAENQNQEPKIDPKTLTMGQLIVIRGTRVSFYIPPTGIEVLQDEKRSGQYIREAATLERLQYCVLKDENGNKRYVRGPDVVFPRPTEIFIEENGTRNFKAIELSPISAIHVKVITDSGEHKVGDELFIKGSEQPIYFPIPEHALVKYGDESIHFAVAVPAGEGRYLLNRLEGNVDTIPGPKMLLPDARTHVFIQRVLDTKLVELMYPGNTAAIEFNRKLAILSQQKPPGDFLTSLETEEALMRGAGQQYRSLAAKGEAQTEFHSETLRRRATFTQPRTITLDTKFQGAVSLDVWTGYAVQITSKSGNRRVVVGNKTVLLDYDETPTILQLSRHTPKVNTDLFSTVYLRVINNRVSDEIEIETKDLFKVKIKLSYWVNFEAEKEADREKWFAVENYVQYLVEHMRSMLRKIAKDYGVEEFNAKAIAIVRDTILGTSEEGKERPGRLFAENGMRIYEVDVHSVVPSDASISKLLIDEQHNAVKQALEITAAERTLEFTKRKEAVDQQIDDEQAKTKAKKTDLEIAEVKKELELALEKVFAAAKEESDRLKEENKQQEVKDKINASTLARERSQEDQRLALMQVETALEVDALQKQFAAISPDLIAALQAIGDKALLGKLAEELSPLAILGGESVVDVAQRLLGGTKLAELLKKLLPNVNLESTR